MTKMLPDDPTRLCEDFLRQEKAYNIGHMVLPSETAIIDRLLDRRVELASAYADLHKRFRGDPRKVGAVLNAIVVSAAHWSPARAVEARRARDRLVAVNRAIADRASELAGLLAERTELQNHSAFSSDSCHHIADVIRSAGRDNGYFHLYLEGELAALWRQYGLKYWPSIEAIVAEIGRDALGARIEASDPLTAAATSGRRPSLADFFKALSVRISEISEGHDRILPRGFRLAAETLASFANCALGLGPEQLVDGAYVRRQRQLERQVRGNADAGGSRAAEPAA